MKEVFHETGSLLIDHQMFAINKREDGGISILLCDYCTISVCVAAKINGGVCIEPLISTTATLGMEGTKSTSTTQHTTLCNKHQQLSNY